MRISRYVTRTLNLGGAIPLGPEPAGRLRVAELDPMLYAADAHHQPSVTALVRSFW